ncbi:DUF5916 domain-containing protein [Pelomonas sp. APW6]|uniref:DUF5916 domain-containing protein n=1 Tax=Roseateles subflavus TaxID=3053353 RepID=A0ABT7LED0_9BURK|nr:DUF5916 domain-containing protein [Pelomonas sp. APW6]MDL5031213.1 DUF5916 domain-containing protein [Pelomonas sp. APW6]
MKRTRHAVASACLALLGSAAARAAELPDMPWPKALRVEQASVQIDGRLDDAIWQRAPIHDSFIQLQPQDKKPARWRTTVQVVADRDALIFGIRCYDDAPEQIRAPLVRRDQVKRDQDYVVVFLDPMGQRRTAQFVRVGANGVVADGSIAAVDDVEDFAPDFDVKAAAHRLPDGYSIELRWPLSTLRYPYQGGADWRLMVGRSVPRDENVFIVSAPLTQDSLHNIAELQPIEGLGDLVQTVRERSFVELRPELTLRRHEERSAATPFMRQNDANLGLELKWRPRADWVIDATLNPDFSQVELDVPQLTGNTRFALQLTEKRPFFLESQDVTGKGQPDESGQARGLAAFYSRAITDPNWGLRATWRGAEAEGTFLSLRDKGGGRIFRSNAYETLEYLPQNLSSQVSFGRLHQQFEHWGAAGLVSIRDYGLGRHNWVLGTDFHANLSEQASMRGHVLMSSTTLGFDDEGTPLRQRAQNGSYVWLEGRHRTEDWANAFHVERLSPRFANDNGFVSQTGIQRLTAQINRRMGSQTMSLPGTSLSWPAYEFEWQLKLAQTSTLSDAQFGVPSGQVMERLVQPGVWFTSARKFEFWAHLGLDAQRARATSPLHQPRTVNLGFILNPSSWFSLFSIDYEFGQRLDVEADRLGRGQMLTVDGNFRFNLPARMALEWNQHLGWSDVRGPQHQRSLQEWLGQSLAVLHFTAQDSLRLILQQRGLSRVADASLEADRRHGSTQSLVYQHRDGLSSAFSVGYTHTRRQPGEAVQKEWFAKYSTVFGR